MRVDVNTSLQRRLAKAVEFQAGEEPDLYFIAEDGARVPAHKSIVCLQSEFLRSLVLSHPGHLTPSLQVPGLTYSDLCSLVSLVYTGMARTEDTDNRSLREAIKALGFDKIRLNVSDQESSSDVEGDKSVIVEDVGVDEAKTDPGSGRKRGPKSKTKMSKFNKAGGLNSPKKISKNSEAVMACKICPNTSFRGLHEFESHLSMEHFVADLVTEYGVRKSKTCVICQESFLSVQKLARHIGSEHHKVIPFYDIKVEDLAERAANKYGTAENQCSFCKIKFRNKKLLGTHIGAVHEKFDEFMMTEACDENQELEVTL